MTDHAARLRSAGIPDGDTEILLRFLGLRFAFPTPMAAHLLKELGVTAEDFNGQLSELKAGVTALTPEQRDQVFAVLFGVDGLRAAMILTEA